MRVVEEEEVEEEEEEEERSNSNLGTTAQPRRPRQARSKTRDKLKESFLSPSQQEAG